jgi:hypothetical protein
MRQILASDRFRKTFYFTLAATLLTLSPFVPVAMVGGVALLTLLPGLQLTRWLGLAQGHGRFRTIAFSLALGLVTSPILIYWSSLLFGYHRWLLLLLFPLYILALAAWLSRAQPHSQPNPPVSAEVGASSHRLWLVASLLIGFILLGVFLAYFELETAQGFYPVQMEDWQKHYGVAFALRHTGIPPTSMFFYGMFPDEPLVYYYFLHLTGATLDLLQGGPSSLHYAFVTVILLAAFSFGTVFFLLAALIFRDQKAALWSLAFATVIGGLDIIPILHRTIQKYRQNFPEGPLPAGLFLPREHVDNWVSALSLRLNTFYAHYIWVPQHLTALTILCLGCYLYLTVPERRKLLLIFPLLLCTLLGHSTWIALIVFGSLFLFALFQLIATYRRRGLAAAHPLLTAYLIIALGFGLVAAPFILTLLGPNAPRSGIAFEIPRLDSWWVLRPLQATFGPALWARLLDLPLHFLIELGALLIAGLAGLILFWRDPPNHPPTSPTTTTSEPPTPSDPPFHLLSSLFSPPSSILHPLPSSLLPFFAFLLILGLLTINLFASGRGWAGLGLIQNNDLGLRAFMPGQLVLALFAGYYLARLPALSISGWLKGVQIGSLALLIGLGLANPAWEFIAMGLAKYWTEPQLSPEIYHTLQALPQVTPPQDKPFPVVQHRLHRNASRFQLSLGSRPVGFSTGEAVVFHRNVQDLALALELSQQAFDNGLPVWSYQMFQNLGANYLFVGPAEREAMRHPEKYRHSQYFQPVYQQGDFEIYRVQPPPYRPDQPTARFDAAAIEFLGYFIDTKPVYPAGLAALPETSTTPYGFVTAWRLTRPADKNYTVFIHLVDAGGNVIAQADHQLWAWSIKSEGPTSAWTPGLIHLDITPIPETALTTQTALTIRLGLWLPDTGQHFLVETDTLEIDAGGRLIVGNLTH